MSGPIRLGDRTTGGGVVISAQLGNFAPIDGKSAIVLGDMATCPKHKGVFPFVECDNSTQFMGKGMVLQGHKLACGCHAISSVAATFNVEPTSPMAYGGAGASRAPVNTIGAGLLANYVQQSLDEAGERFSGRFQLIDEGTGEPVAGHRIRVRSTGGQILEGITDAEGFTEWVERDAAESLSFELPDAQRDEGASG